jgi:RimJ/RimL family protein N-acetyltransferase
MAVTDVIQTARQLRAQGKIRESFELVRSNAGAKTRQSALLWQHQPFFWDDVAGGNCILTRRCGTDAAFIHSLWQNTAFVQQFNRMAVRIPQDYAVLERILNSEYTSLVGDLNSLHWIVRDDKQTPWGILSLTNISLAHRRAEVLLGVADAAPFGLATAAMYTLFRFFFRTMQFHKLYTLTFDDNPHALKGVMHLGFSIEGRMRQHFRDQVTGDYIDMVQAGLLADEAFSTRNTRLMRRLNFN